MPAATYKSRCESAANEITWLANVVQIEAELVPAGTPCTIAPREEKVLRKFAGSLKALASGLNFYESAGSSNLLCNTLTAAGRFPEAMRRAFREMVVKVSDGGLIRLRDIATVSLDAQGFDASVSMDGSQPQAVTR